MTVDPLTILVTGGAGFIGSAVCRHIINDTAHTVINIDKLTYAGTLTSLNEIEKSNRYTFVQADICDADAMAKIMRSHNIDAVMNLAAESHVDRSIDGPGAFIQTNIVGTATMLDVSRQYWSDLPSSRAEAFRFLHISTDEVFGDLPLDDSLFTEETAYDPSSPYSASKASSDHLVRAWNRTYGLPIILTNCSNNYGPFHFPEKLIPLIILNALAEKPLPVYGKGENVRDWLFVDDHARALVTALENGEVGRSYNVGGRNERSNLEVVHTICDRLDLLRPRENGTSYRELIEFTKDRPGHDLRYAIDASRLENELGWKASHSFDTGIAATIDWYLENEWWWKPLQQRYSGQRPGQTDKP